MPGYSGGFFILASGVSIAATAPDTTWESYIGANENKYAEGVWQTSDNGFIIVGTGPDATQTGSNLYLVKADWQGTIEWSKQIGGGYGYGVRQTSDGGYIAVGAYSDDIYLVKTDGDGNVQWEKIFKAGQQLIGLAVTPTGDGGYFIVAQVAVDVADWDVYYFKTDANGNKLWDKTISVEAGKDNICYSVWQNIDGTYILGGVASEGYNPKPYLVLVDANGNVAWSKIYSVEGEEQWENYNNGWNGVQQTRDGGFIYAGCKGSYGYLMKTDANGNKQWDKAYELIQTGFDAVQQTWDDGYILTGYYMNTDEDADQVEVVRTDANGNQQWRQTYAGMKYAEGRSVLQIGNGSFVVAGWTGNEQITNKNMYLLQLNKDMTPVPNADYIGDTIPSTMEANAAYTVTVTFANDGTMPWTV